MDKNVSLPTVKFSDLREDEVKKTENDLFWKNVSEKNNGYVITARVKGV